MKKRSKSLQAAIDQINRILADERVYVNNQFCDSLSEEGKAFKQGLIEALELVLHRTDTYKGYAYNSVDRDSLYERKYY